MLRTELQLVNSILQNVQKAGQKGQKNKADGR